MSTAEPAGVLHAIRALLTREGVAFREIEHAPAPTCEDAARERGEPLRIGGKCLLLKAGGEFGLFALSAALQLDSHRLRRALGERRLRFATEEELLRLTGLVPGALPPFGEPILPFTLHADESLARSDRIAFNAGALDHSIVLATSDWLRLAQPRVMSYGAKVPEPSRVVLAEKLALFDERWSPRVVAELNGQEVKLAKLEGDFPWHAHEGEDELFLVLKGELCIRFRDREVRLGEGELLVVPRGVEHAPRAEAECHVLLFEPAGTRNTGQVDHELTVERPERI